MKNFSDEKMMTAFAELSASSARNRVCAQQAEKKSDLQTARLLEAIAESESIKARRALVYLRGKAPDLLSYIKELTERKRQAASVDYPALSKLYGEKGDKHEAETFSRYAAVAENHQELLTETTGTQEAAVLYICNVCGYIEKGSAPENCPVCRAVRKKFKTLH